MQKIYVTCKKKNSPWWKFFLQHVKIEPPYFSGQINKAKVSTQLYQAMLWWPRIDVHKKGYTRTAVAPYDDFTTISLRKEEEKKSQPVAKIRISLHERWRLDIIEPSKSREPWKPL